MPAECQYSPVLLCIKELTAYGISDGIKPRERERACNYMVKFHWTCSTYKMGEFKGCATDYMMQRLTLICPALFCSQSSLFSLPLGGFYIFMTEQLNGPIPMWIIVIHSCKDRDVSISGVSEKIVVGVWHSGLGEHAHTFFPLPQSSSK